jgi:kinesin family protein 5
LKESLGGNNKTTLVITCSMHHSNLEETISSLRFASRAKFIRNNIKMNVKIPTEQLQIIIKTLKNELIYCKKEIVQLRTLSVHMS